MPSRRNMSNTRHNARMLARLRKKGKLNPTKEMTDEELLQSAQAMLVRQGLKPTVDKSNHSGVRWSLIDGKKIYHI